MWSPGAPCRCDDGSHVQNGREGRAYVTCCTLDTIQAVVEESDKFDRCCTDEQDLIVREPRERQGLHDLLDDLRLRDKDFFKTSK